MPQTNINIRMDSELKKQFDALCNELGLTMTAAVNILAKAMIRHNGMPFEITINRNYNAETKQAIEDAINHRNVSKPYDNLDELFEDLNA